MSNSRIRNNVATQNLWGPNCP